MVTMNEVVAAMRSLVGVGHVLEAAEVATRSAGFLRADHLQAGALVRPGSVEEVSAVLRWCHAQGVPVVTQGGLTGLVHGSDASGSELILSLERLRMIEEIDPRQRVARVQAGVTLQDLQEAAQAHELMFPLDLGARGSCTLGGNASTNAGGNRVIRYGMTRDMVLGVEAVLADGTVVSSLNTLIKNNAGYDLKHLFIGSEGTLGVITRLVLRLREKPVHTHMALAGLARFDDVVQLLKHMDRSTSGALSAFEVMWQPFYRLVTTPPSLGRPPIGQDHAFYVLMEAQGSTAEAFESALEQAMERDWVQDAALAQNESEMQAFWSLRDDVAQTMLGGTPVIFDISLPIAQMQAYTEALPARLEQAIGAHRLWIFGHLGDGNLHVVVQVQSERVQALRPQIEAVVYAPLAAFKGSVSAEHGIGLEKKPYLALSRSPEELTLMRTLKVALDPKGILNPGKVVDR